MDLQGLPLWANALILAMAGGGVWFAGMRLSGYADVIAERTGIGQALAGLLLLGAITSLPEVAVSGTSALSGNAALAVNNLLGGLAMQVVLLALADAMIGRDALTSVVARPIVLLQGILNVLLLVIVAAGIMVGDIAVFGLGAWTILIFVVYLLAIWLSARYRSRTPWVVRDGRSSDEHPDGARAADPGTGGERPSLRSAVLKMLAAAGVIFVAGFLVSRTGEAIAQQSGLGSSLVGAVLIALTTSLPEISTIFGAVRLHRYEMAVSDIFGTNLFDAALVFLVDALYAGQPVLNEVGAFSGFAALLGIAVTAIYIAGLIERQDRTVARMGIDSLAVLATYAAGIVVLYSLR